MPLQQPQSLSHHPQPHQSTRTNARAGPQQTSPINQHRYQHHSQRSHDLNVTGGSDTGMERTYSAELEMSDEPAIHDEHDASHADTRYGLGEQPAEAGQSRIHYEYGNQRSVDDI